MWINVYKFHIRKLYVTTFGSKIVIHFSDSLNRSHEQTQNSRRKLFDGNYLWNFENSREFFLAHIFQLFIQAIHILQMGLFIFEKCIKYFL